MKWLILLALCISSLTFAIPLQERKIEPNALCELAITLGISPEQDLISETQKQWLRKPGQERWEVEELSAEQKYFVLNWATDQGLYADWKPCCESYDKALILGATTSRMQMRLNHLIQLWNEGTRFQEVVWLSGDRPLDNRVDSLLERAATESEAALIIWEETPLPQEMRNLPVVFIAVPMKGQQRPNTQDTILAWLKNSQKPCKALFISNQPFCGYQFSVINSLLPNSFLFDVVGPGVDPESDPSAAITLDSIARWIYQDSLAFYSPKL